MQPELPPEIRASIVELLRKNQKIAAIKLYRETTRRELKDSKEAVEEIARADGIATRTSPGGCLIPFLGFLIITALILAALLWLRSSR